MMSIIPADLTMLRDRHPHNTRLYMSILQPSIVFLGTVSSSLDQGAMTITVNTTSGDVEDCESGMTVYVYKANYTYKRRCKGNNSGNLLVDENNIAWEQDDIIKVVHDYELWSVFPRIVVDDNGDVTFYKDYDIAYSDDNELYGPIAIIGGLRCINVNDYPIRMTWWATDSYTMTDGATIVGYEWKLREGADDIGTVSGDNTSSLFVVDIDEAHPDGLWLSLTVTDSNGKSQITRCVVFIHDNDNKPYTDFTLSGLSGDWDSGGWTATITTYGTRVDYDDYVVLWHESEFDQGDALITRYIDGCSEILLCGRTHYDNAYNSDGTVTGSVHIRDIVALLRARRSFSLSLEYNTSPTTWYQCANLNTARAIYHVWRWHSTLLEICNVYIDIPQTDSVLLYAVDDFVANTLYDMVDTFTRQNSIFAHVVATKSGDLYCQVEYNMLNDTARGNVPYAMEILDEDLQGSPAVSIMRNPSRPWLIQASGVYFDGSDFTPHISAAPGQVPEAHGNDDMTVERLAISGQTDLNEKCGRLFAIMDLDVDRIPMVFAGNYSFIDLMPQRTYLFQSGRVFNGLIVPRNIQIQIESGFISAVNVDFQPEAQSGIVGSTVIVPDPPPPPDPPDPPDPPIIPPPPGIIPGDGFGTCYVMVADNIGRTRDLSQTSPQWSSVLGSITGSLADFILDPWDPHNRAYALASSGVWRSDNLLDSVPTWTQVLSDTDITAANGAWGYAYKISGSINVENYVGFWFMATTNYATYMKYAYSYDSGNTWDYVNIAGPYKSVGSGFAGAADILPHLIDGNIVLCVGFNVLHSGSTYYSYVYTSQDSGATWQLKHTNGGSTTNYYALHYPYDGNEDGLNIWAKYTGISVGYQALQSLDGGSTWNVKDSPGTGGTGRPFRGLLETWTFDRTKAYHWENDGVLRYSDNEGLTWTSGATPIGIVKAGGGFPFNGEQMYNVSSSGTSFGIYVTLDRGDTWMNKTGDWAFGKSGGRYVVVPVWLSED